MRDYEPHLALRRRRRRAGLLSCHLRTLASVLRVGGRLLFEVGIGQADDVLRMMRSVGFGDLEIIPDPTVFPGWCWGTCIRRSDCPLPDRLCDTITAI